jgi:DNA mismatch repair protein MutS
MALIKEYFTLTEKYTAEYGPNTVVLLQVGAFFEVYGQLSSIIDDNRPVICIGSRIDDFCVICELAKANKTAGIVMAGFRDYGLDKYLKKLQDAGFTAVVYVQDGIKTPPTRILQGVYSPGTYFSTDCVGVGGGGVSGGNLSNNIACIWMDKISRRVGSTATRTLLMGMSNIDIYTGRSTIFETENNDLHNPTTYDEVERFISSYCPSEVVIISNLSEREVEDIIHYTNITSKMIHRIFLSSGDTENAVVGPKEQKAVLCTKQIYQMEVLNVFFPNGHAKSLEHSFLSYEIATQSLVFLLNFIYEHNPSLVSRIQEPIFENMSDRLVLANHSLRQLNIIDDGNAAGGGSTRTSSVMSLLNHTITPMGSRAYKNTLLHPTFNEATLEMDYNITDHLLHNRGNIAGDCEDTAVNIQIIRDTLNNMKDIEKLHRHIILQKITPSQCFGLFHNLRHIHGLYNVCSRDSILLNHLSERWKIKNNIVDVCTMLMKLFEKTIDIELCRDITDTFFETNIIRGGVSDELDKIVYTYHRSMKSLEGVQRILNEMIYLGEKPNNVIVNSGGAELDYVKIHETDKMGISLQATKRRTKLIEDRIKRLPNKIVAFDIDNDVGNADSKFVFDTSSITFPVASGSNNTVHSQQIYELCSSIISSRNKMSDMVSVIYYGFIRSLHEYYHDFENMIAFVSAIDMIQNRCFVARKYNYCRPIIATESSISATATATATAAAAASFVRATDIRHCIIERINEDECYVTNDIALGSASSSVVVPIGTTDAPDGMLLYGTNAVGKTSLIRAIGVAVIMAQAGFYVPATSFVYKPYRSIMTRILGNDNLFKGLSTFVVEMSELRVILRMANEHTLVLGDELCSGTEIDSAISIFVAGLQHLHRAGSSYIFATHLHEIANYVEIQDMMPRLRLAHMRVFYDKSRDTLIYDRKLQEGAGESMYGLEVCKSLHLPEDFLEYANQIRVKYRGVNAKTPTASILDDAVPSRYNASKLRRVCEMCEKKRGTEIHHLQHQENADENDYIGHIHKNHPANLASLCEDCHQSIHKAGVQHIKVQTGKGAKIVAMAGIKM